MESPSETSPTGARGREAIPPTHLRILVVDRNPHSADLFRTSLKLTDPNCQLDSVVNPGNALAWLERASSEKQLLPDVIVTGTEFDRGEDGLVFAQEVRREYPDIFVAVLTSSRLDIDITREEQRESGAHLFLEGPINRNKLTDLLQRAKEYRMRIPQI